MRESILIPKKRQLESIKRAITLILQTNGTILIRPHGARCRDLSAVGPASPPSICLPW